MIIKLDDIINCQYDLINKSVKYEINLKFGYGRTS